jgi:subtilisin family serine protease
LNKAGNSAYFRFSRYAGLLLPAIFFFFYGTATANAVNFTGTVRTGNYKQGEILVKFKPGVSAAGIRSINSSLGVSGKSTIGKTGIEIITIPANRTVEEAVADFQNMPEVEFAQPNYRYHALATIPNDTGFSKQWGLDNTGQTVNGTTGIPDADIDAPEAWDITTGSSSVIVAVIDSGVAYNHPDLAGNIWANIDETDGNGIDNDGNGFKDDVRGWDFVDNDNDPMDFNGHGSHIAGIIGAVGNNGQGMAGIAWKVQIMPVRVLAPDGFGFTSDITAGIDYAVNNGAKIINLSFGENPGDPPDSAVQAAIQNAKNAGVLAVIAAGNDSNDNDALPVYPASYTLENIISVAATDQSDNLAYFSNYGAASVDVGAPGVDIYSALPAREIILTEGFESGAVGWSMGKISGDTWLVSTLQSHAGAKSLSDGSEALPYQSNADSWATSPTFSLASKTGCTMSAQFDYITEANKDFIFVKASKDGTGYSTLASGQLSGDSLTWEKLTFSLKPYEGNSTVSIRFELVTDGATNKAGVYIDDVSVTCSSTSFNGTEYDFSGGTSFSTPYVAGLAALLLAGDSSFTVTQLKALILDNGDTASALGGKTVSGKRINAFNSLVATATPISSAVTASSGGGGGGGGCFIATAAYGSYLEPHVMVLRRFRDRYLLPNRPGQFLVELYYRYSPPIAGVIAGSPTLRAAARLALTPVVYGLMYPSAALFFLVVSALAFVGLRYRKRPASG